MEMVLFLLALCGAAVEGEGLGLGGAPCPEEPVGWDWSLGQDRISHGIPHRISFYLVIFNLAPLPPLRSLMLDMYLTVLLLFF